MSDQIEIRGLRAFGRHGVFDAEQRDGQIFVIDLWLDVDLQRAANTDDLEHTVHYGELAERIAEEVGATRFDLIERLAGHLLDVVMKDERIERAQVRIAKPDAPVAVDLDEVAVRLTRSRPTGSGP